MLTLGIETSCDETAVCILKGRDKILSSVISSSIKYHSRFGGVVPEIASRHHVEYIDYCIKKALSQAKVHLKDIDLIAVTYGPGLVGALLVGVSMAKAISYSLNIPLVGVNHLLAHLHVNHLSKNPPKYPHIGLVISGGHTSLIYMEDFDKYKILGQTQDDAIGEAFDKAAKVLQLGYPGGPIIEKKAISGNPESISFTKAVTDDRLGFSFSGIKTALLHKVRALGDCPYPTGCTTSKGLSPSRHYSRLSLKCVKDLSASFQKTVVDMVTERAIQACLDTKAKRIVVGGGVSANSYLRKHLASAAKNAHIKVYFPPFKLSLDNAVMVAALGYKMYKNNRISNLDLTVSPNLGLESL